MVPALKAIAVIAAAMLLAAPAALAWGPVSHYRMTCAALHPGVSVADCATASANEQLIVGTDLPDAFYFGLFITGSTCTQARGLHNLEFAGYQVKLAMQEQQQAVHQDPSFDALQYALGFGAHVAGDFAGFYPGAYLGNGHSPNGPSWRNWISLWQFMTVVDAHVLRNHSMPPAQLPRAPLPQAGAAFIARATAYAKQKGASFPVLTPAAAFNCTTVWSETVNRNVDVAASFSLGTIADSLVFFDRYGATTLAAAEAHLELAIHCGIKVISAWAADIQKASTTPLQALETAYELLESLVGKGECNVAPPTDHGDL